MVKLPNVYFRVSSSKLENFQKSTISWAASVLLATNRGTKSHAAVPNPKLAHVLLLGVSKHRHFESSCHTISDNLLSPFLSQPLICCDPVFAWMRCFSKEVHK